MDWFLYDNDLRHQKVEVTFPYIELLFMNTMTFPWSEAATTGVIEKKVFLKISQNSQENTCARVSFLIKLLAWGLQLY